MTWFRTKREARREVEERGYVLGQGPLNEDDHEGHSGDHGFGSRLYYYHPDGPLQDNGLARVTATVSRVGREWATSYFGEELLESGR